MYVWEGKGWVIEGAAWGEELWRSRAIRREGAGVRERDDIGSD